MKRLVFILGALILVLVAFSASVWSLIAPSETPPVASNSASNTSSSANAEDIPVETVIAENLDTPWALALLPDGKLLVTERFGRVTRIDPTGKEDPVVLATLENVKELGEGGLLGIALHPDFVQNKYVYLYLTYSSIGNDTLNRVVRMQLNANTLEDEQILLDRIPGASNHNGGRIAFGPDKMLYIGTGDAQNPTQAQLTNTLAGKILRVTDEGKPAPQNPFDNAVYSYGHRNVQGLAWDESGGLWATEHGRSGLESGLDELNLIVRGSNYGWPTIEGDKTQQGMVIPAYNSGATETWAPSGAAFANNAIYFSGLRGRGLYQAEIANGRVTNFTKHLDNKYGRIREVISTPDGILYITTSNRDGRGVSGTGDDKIIRINPEKL